MDVCKWNHFLINWSWNGFPVLRGIGTPSDNAPRSDHWLPKQGSWKCPQSPWNSRDLVGNITILPLHPFILRRITVPFHQSSPSPETTAYHRLSPYHSNRHTNNPRLQSPTRSELLVTSLLKATALSAIECESCNIQNEGR